MSEERSKPNFKLYAVLAILAALLTIPQWNRGLNLSDEGLVWDGAAQHRAGTLDQGIFGHFTSRYAFEDFVLRLGGDDLLSLRLLWTLMRFATAFMLGAVALRFGGIAPALLAVLAFSAGPGPIHKSMIGFFEMIAVVFMTLCPRRCTPPWAAVFGLILSAATALHPYTGVGLLAAAVAFIVWKEERRRTCLPVLVIVYAAMLPVLAPWMLNLELSAAVRRQATLVASEHLGFRDLATAAFTGFRTPGASGIAEAAIPDFFLLSVLAVATLFFIFKNDGQRTHREALLAVSLVALCGAPKMIARPDLPHFLQNAPPFYVLSALALGHTMRDEKLRFSSPAFLFSSASVLILVFILTINGASPDYYVGSPAQAARKGVRLDVTSAGFVDRPNVIEATRKVLDQIEDHTRGGDFIFCAPFCPGFYRLSERRNPLPLSHFMRPEDFFGYSQERVIAGLKKNAPAAVVLENYTTDGKRDNRFETVAPTLFWWIIDHYSPVWQIGPYRFYEIRPAKDGEEPKAPSLNQPPSVKIGP